MRILSRHHDYYDWVAGYGVDRSITYARTPTSMSPQDERVPWRMDAPLERDVHVAEGRYLRFEVTIGIFPQAYHRWMCILSRPGDAAQVRVFAQHADAVQHAQTLGVQPRRRPRWWYAGDDPALREDRRLSDAQWRQVGAPLFAIAPIGWIDNRVQLASEPTARWYTTNPILADMRFTEVPAQDVFQRIQSFLRLDPAPPKEFDDALKIKARGFDRRSFRHRKGPHRK